MNCLVCNCKLSGICVASSNQLCQSSGHLVHIECFRGNLSRGSGCCYVCRAECEGYVTVTMDSENGHLEGAKSLVSYSDSSDESSQSGTETDVLTDDDLSATDMEQNSFDSIGANGRSAVEENVEVPAELLHENQELQLIGPVPEAMNVSDEEEESPPLTGRNEQNSARARGAVRVRRTVARTSRGRRRRTSLPQRARSQFQFTCQVCHKSFKSTGGKSKCQKRHEGPFLCNCGRTYQWYSCWTDHKKVCTM